ncbi:MAG TPA: hypothetical protein VGC77_01685 [Rhodopseudomonas sp.]|uniref:hypothetical protein n=1 Tax=Rhodopseudomonas sp. TaxID=1078 RepID=UPI002ED8F5FF
MGNRDYLENSKIHKNFDKSYPDVAIYFRPAAHKRAGDVAKNQWKISGITARGSD